MDFVFELLFELIFDSTIEIARNAKVSKWVRYPSINFAFYTRNNCSCRICRSLHFDKTRRLRSVSCRICTCCA